VGGRRRKEGAWAEPRAGLARDPRGAPLSALSRLAAASPPPAPGVEREPLPPSRAGGPRALARARLHLHPSGLTASRLGPHRSSSSFGGLSALLPASTPPTPRSGRSGRRLPGGALPGARSEPAGPSSRTRLARRLAGRLPLGGGAPAPSGAPRSRPTPPLEGGRLLRRGRLDGRIREKIFSCWAGRRLRAGLSPLRCSGAGGRRASALLRCRLLSAASLCSLPLIPLRPRPIPRRAFGWGSPSPRSARSPGNASEGLNKNFLALARGRIPAE
jgi:hypothetical protein